MTNCCLRTSVGFIGILAVGLCASPRIRGEDEPPARGPLVLHARAREAVAVPAGSPSTDAFHVKEEVLHCEPTRTAIIICDMWDQHWCRGATRRVGELAPAMNRAVAAARARGALIIHAPSSCMDAYKDH